MRGVPIRALTIVIGSIKMQIVRTKAASVNANGDLCGWSIKISGTPHQG